MKTCPICMARAFDDADVCYGCLHRFDQPGGKTCDGGGCARTETSLPPVPMPAPPPRSAVAPASPVACGGASPNAEAIGVASATGRAERAPSEESRETIESGPVVQRAMRTQSTCEARGWIVTFELPGFGSVEGGGVEPLAVGGASPTENAAVPRFEGRHPHGFVVRFVPPSCSAAGSRKAGTPGVRLGCIPRDGDARGTHARADRPIAGEGPVDTAAGT